MNGIISGSGGMSGSVSGKSGIGGSAGRTVNHPTLRGRELPDQHPIESITSLGAELTCRPSEAMTNLQIQAILNS